ncbi:MAG: hypothetical protein LJE68_17930 [Rhodobacter sp.]|jgi:hypothetical protein|nr:hypothetical protein [Rhodobacter sp.]
MVQEVWLHIGTPKSGTSSLQKYLVTHREALAQRGLAYLTPPGKTSSNDLAIAINRNRAELADMADGLNREIAERPEQRALISSEMFYGVSPDMLLALIPELARRPLNVLVYLRRQDRYIESMYLQKSKNGRFQGSIADYIARFEGSGSDYAAQLSPWQAAGGQVRLIPRVLERTALQGEDVVSDAFALMDMPGPTGAADNDVNVSPGLHRVQLLQAAAAADLANPRRLQRRLAALYPQEAGERTPILSRAERVAFLGQHAAGNEALRAQYFPDRTALFDTADLRGDGPEDGIPPFTDAQLDEIRHLFAALKSLL